MEQYQSGIWFTASEVSGNLWCKNTGQRYYGIAPESDIFAEWTDAPTGPVRTVTRKEIVSGRYGHVQVTECYGVAVAHMGSAAEIRTAIATLTEIAAALEEQ